MRICGTRIVAILVLCLGSICSAPATEQTLDRVVVGGREYPLHEIPMLGLWDYGPGNVAAGKQKPPAFEVQSTANWAGYEATFEVRDSKLWLREIKGKIAGRLRKNEEIIAGERFPIVADWFTGRIHLEVGDFDDDRQEATLVIIHHIEKGVVTRIEFAERMKRVWTWNGLSQEPARTE